MSFEKYHFCDLENTWLFLDLKVYYSESLSVLKWQTFYIYEQNL